ncbi:hypothetical protein SCLCIDRAFT_781932 [Scleroderma citrinum Foug A]|uniref:Uncharacterized protein n=1 Tax=Scleroderma citrinum Foug A TaxID=1036808 RepID=A0A0C3DQH0_9AGAM|nr:hypothetical protein SCLCIDRAFT_781932 [Scleroderma citrinum Foug A]
MSRLARRGPSSFAVPKSSQSYRPSTRSRKNTRSGVSEMLEWHWRYGMISMASICRLLEERLSSSTKRVWLRLLFREVKSIVLLHDAKNHELSDQSRKFAACGSCLGKGFREDCRCPRLFENFD